MIFRLTRLDLRLDKIAEDKRREIVNKIARKGLQIFRQEIKKRHLVNSGNLLDSVSVTKFKSSVKFEVGAEHAGIINAGVRRHKMRYLVGAGPIPIITKKGQKIFRVATNKNIRQRGRWIHPGFTRGKGFFDTCKIKISAFSSDLIARELV
jgi:hypothetical protein